MTHLNIYTLPRNIEISFWGARDGAGSLLRASNSAGANDVWEPPRVSGSGGSHEPRKKTLAICRQCYLEEKNNTYCRFLKLTKPSTNKQTKYRKMNTTLREVDFNLHLMWYWTKPASTQQKGNTLIFFPYRGRDGSLGVMALSLRVRDALTFANSTLRT